MKWKLLLLMLLVAVAGVMLWHKSRPSQRWAVLYTREGDPAVLQQFDLLVFDRDGHPDLAALKDGKRVLLGYVSFGEAEPHRKDYEAVKALGVLISGVPEWKGGDFLDVRKAQWRDYMLGTIIPSLLAEGFTGVMLDTTDNLVWLENKDPQTYAGLKQAAVALIKDIRRHYPKLHIMMNRGLDILPEVRGDIDSLMAESVYTSWNLATGTPRMASENDQRHYLEKLHMPWWQISRPTIYSLDYWPPDQAETVKNIYKAQRNRGFVPYVSTPDLQKLHVEPR